MLKLESICKDATVNGIVPNQVVRVVTTEPVGDNALTVYYRTPDGQLAERMLFRTDEPSLALADVGRPWAFDAPGNEFKLALEAYRIHLAYLFDPMMAVHTSDVEPLPHQITAVYESMLPKQPLRYVLADDPGAGKTIMAGLFMGAPPMRADARRILVIAPGSLVEQWQDELYEKFGLTFHLFSRELEQSKEAVELIHGGIQRDERRKVQALFRNDPTARVLLATDAAGEGVNLQNANLMVNYDLPWNPNRLEQRFGRIHRIGQTQVCHLWNLVASETREGDVFQRLFEKLEIERQALGGRVFDVLGEVFDNSSLRELLIKAIRYGDDPAIQAQLYQVVEGALDTEHLKAIIQRNALCEEVMSPERLFAVKEEMEKAEARKLQPYFIRSFFQQAFTHL